MQNQSLVKPPHSKPATTEPEIPEPNKISMAMAASTDSTSESGGQSLDAHQCWDIQYPSDEAAASVEGKSDYGLKEEDESGREKLERHRDEVAGRVWVPDIWGQEDLLKDWIDCSGIHAALVPNGIMSARSALVEEARRSSANSGTLREQQTC